MAEPPAFEESRSKAVPESFPLQNKIRTNKGGTAILIALFLQKGGFFVIMTGRTGENGKEG